MGYCNRKYACLVVGSKTQMNHRCVNSKHRSSQFVAMVEKVRWYGNMERCVFFLFFFCKQEADFITTRTIDKRDSPTHSAVWRSAFLFRLLLQLRHWERDKRSYCDRKFRWIISEQVFKFTRVWSTSHVLTRIICNLNMCQCDIR